MTSAPTRRLAIALAVFVAGLAAIAGGLFAWRQAQDDAYPGVGGPFSLTDQNGRTVTDADLKGAPYLLFFGFTHCPDICPSTLYEVSQMFQALGRDAPVRAVFITVDPERDTPQVLKDYLGSFDPRIIGLTGPKEQVAAALKAFRVYAKKAPQPDGEYTMDHTAMVYLMDRRGRFAGGFNLKRPPEEAAAEYRKYM
ncbi:SCO family protein [Camelimonas abortus]|uniref:SCO family protein n=1 Tax=Camelimonas abortus TaxID=1017184 RepID=A0ABV7LDA6_9HYPH